MLRLIATSLLLAAAAGAQDPDPGARAAAALGEATDGALKLTLEFRGRYETRTGNTFGRDPDIDTGLFRTRVGLSYTPARWLKFSGMLQDSRAPWYGENAPNTVRDEADLHESYIELFPASKQGFGMTAGRMMLNYGEGRLIGTPQWSNLSRTYDHARVYWRTAKARFEVLLVSPVKIRIGEFNRPVLGDRVWGTYNVFPNLVRKNGFDFYFLRHEQNRPGGFTGGSSKDGTDRMSANTLGFRATGPVGAGVKYSVEGAIQRGKVAAADLRASAWFTAFTRRWMVGGRSLDVDAEYKYASGTRNPADSTHTSTFDQLYPANHDKFGHEDLFGWRNIHNLRSLTTFAVTKRLSLNFMYDEFWLASARDGLYNGAGKLIVRSPDGSAGTHVGRETDLFGVYKFGHFLFGAGYGHLFSGEFLRKTTPGTGPTYLYIFHTYSL